MSRSRCRPGRLRAAGFSLVELLVASALGLLLIAGTVTVLAGNRRSAELNAAVAEMQEAGRFALATLASDIRMSGHQGCIDPNGGSLRVRAASAPTDDLRRTSTTAAAIETATTWSPAPPNGFVPLAEHRAVPGTHALALQFGDTKRSALAAQMANPSAPLRLVGDVGIESGDLAIVANCDFGDLFRVSAASADGLTLEHAAPENESGSLTRAYGNARTIAQTRVMRFRSNVYFVGDTGLRNGRGGAVHALYRQTLPYDAAVNPPTEIAQGVENLRLAFGQRDGATLRYVAPGTPGFDPSRVETVRIGLLMASFDDVTDADNTRSYTLAGQTILASEDPDARDAHPIDRRHRLVLDTTVKVRNRRSAP